MQVQALDLNTALQEAMNIDGALGVAIVDLESGISLGTLGGGAMDMELAAAGNRDFILTKMRIKEQLGLASEELEEILITISGQYHLIRLARNQTGLFTYLALDRQTANLGLARIQLRQSDEALSI